MIKIRLIKLIDMILHQTLSEKLSSADLTEQWGGFAYKSISSSISWRKNHPFIDLSTSIDFFTSSPEWDSY